VNARDALRDAKRVGLDDEVSLVVGVDISRDRRADLVNHTGALACAGLRAASSLPIVGTIERNSASKPGV